MTPDERQKLKEEMAEHLAKTYFLIPKNTWWAFLGGAAAFTVAIGFVSYKSALSALAEPTVAAAVETIKDHEARSASALRSILNNWESSQKLEDRVKVLEAGIPPAQKQLLIQQHEAARMEELRKKNKDLPRGKDR